MSYNHQELPGYVRTAGKITVVTAITGLLVFIVAFIFDAGTKELSKVSAAGNATTTLTVLNTPPEFTVKPYEVIGSSTSTPTNSGDSITWSAIGTDTNGAPYFLLICDSNATPTANPTVGALGTAAPSCNATSSNLWAVSTGTLSGTLATAATTTTEVAPFNEINNWYAWVCDDDPVNPRCNSIPEQGDYATSSSPFNVNKRPVLTDFYNNGPADPGSPLTFFSTSSDPDVLVDNEITLVVCGTNSYSTVTNNCTANFLSSSSISFTDNAYATITIPAIMIDQPYSAFGFLVDEFGHEALANPISEPFIVNNVAPVVSGGDIKFNTGATTTDIVLTQPAAETTGFTLDFKIRDANSCLNSASTSEITGYDVVVFRGGIGTSTCDGTAGSYNANNCYPSGVGAAVWNLSCNATTTCASSLQDEIEYTCSFPLWFLADPTDSLPGQVPAFLDADMWSAGVAGIDDDGLTGFMATTSNPVELISFKSIDILAAEIVYGGIEPGDDTGTLVATSTLLNVGNVALDQQAQGESMCGTFTVATECPVSATSTIPEDQQKFSSTSLAYTNPWAITLSSTTPNEVELNVKKTVSTSSPKQGVTYWGIAVPSSITLAGSYTGMNTFTAVTAEEADWY